MVSHVASRLLADVADRIMLTGELSQVLAGLRKLRARHDPGRVLVDMAVAVADGTTTISEVAVLADQGELFAGGGVGLDVLAAFGPARHRCARSGRIGAGLLRGR